jgi:uncharacterized protein (TIGR02996 family)
MDLAAILANPDDDGPRLVYADWLLQREDPRGELITVQCELARRDDDDTTEHRRLKRRESLLLSEHASAWLGPLAAAADKWTFRRGFLDHLALRERPRPEDLDAWAPLLTSLDLGWTRNDAGACAALLSLPRVRRLTTMHHSAEVARFLAAQPAVAARLRELTLHGLGTAAVANLVELSALASLEALDVGYGSLGDDGIRAIAASPMTLRALGLYQSRITALGVEVLAAAPRLAGLRALDLGDNAIGAAGIAALVAAPAARCLVTLGLVRTKLDRAAAAAIGAAFPQLAALDLLGNSLRADGAEALLGTGGLGALRELVLQQCRLGDAGVAHLAASPIATHLEVLSLRSNLLTDAAARALAKAPAPAFERLVSLNLNNNKIGRSGQQALLASAQLQHAKIYVKGGAAPLARAKSR